MTPDPQLELEGVRLYSNLGKGLSAASSSVALLTWLGTACALVQVQPVVFCSPRDGAVARHSMAQGPLLPVTRFWD